MQGFRAISRHLSGWTGSIGGFVRDLDRRGTRYLSYSKVSSLEFCPYRYYLEFVRKLQLRPQPDYYVKGNIFHAAAARYYRRLAGNRSLGIESLHAFVDQRRRPDGKHLKNAITLAVQNVHAEWEIVGVEEPFVLSLGNRLPPCIGVIDLILRQGKRYAVVDHKTGKQFSEPNNLQVTLYREYVCRRYSADSCRAFYDEYRWVNNLDKVRKPAFRRTEVMDIPEAWKTAENRFAESFSAMREIERSGDAPATGPCYICPFKSRCTRSGGLGFPY